MNAIEPIAGKRVLVLGDYRQTVVVVRSLARAGYRVTLGAPRPPGATARSRYVSDLWLYEPGGDDSFHRQLETYLRTAQPDFVFPVGESQLRSLLGVAPRFEPLAVWVAPAWATVARCFDKSAMYALTRQLSIPTMSWHAFSDAVDWRRAAAALGYPVVVKRRDSSALVRGRKALILPSPASFEDFLAGLPRDPDPASLLLQKFAPGARYNCHFGAAAGRLLAYFEQKVLRTDELDGTGIGIEGVSVVPSPALRAHCQRLLEALGYDGIGCIQFLVDEASGEVAFLELNPRMDSTAALPYRLHYDFPRLAVDLARLRGTTAVTPLTAPYRVGVRYHWLYGDLFAWYAAWRQRQQTPLQLLAWAWRSALAAFACYHLTWEWRDPLPTWSMYRARLARRRAGKMRGERLAQGEHLTNPVPAHNIEALRSLACRRLPRVVRDYLEGGAEDESTLRANRAAFAGIAFAPRTLVDVSRRSQHVVVLGQRFEQPFGISPIGAAGLFRHGADIDLACAAQRSGVPFILSTHAFVPFARVAQAAGAAPWFQLYMVDDRAAVEQTLRQVRAAGGEVIVVTTDVPVGGNREYNERNGFCIPFRLGLGNVADGLCHPAWLLQAGLGLWQQGSLPAHGIAWGARRDALSWADFGWLREAWPGKLVLKGILSVEDAQLAARYGADGVFVSNHGGRQLDGAPATIEVLPEIAAAVGGRLAVLIDGGFRRGSDIVKALALGADMVFVGRPAIYGVTVDGELGARQVLSILGDEVDRVMALLGCRSIAELGPHFLRSPLRRRGERTGSAGTRRTGAVELRAVGGSLLRTHRP